MRSAVVIFEPSKAGNRGAKISDYAAIRRGTYRLIRRLLPHLTALQQASFLETVTKTVTMAKTKGWPQAVSPA
jgi:hypothetical protein